MKNFVPCVEVAIWANDNDALIPELWAMEALRTLSSNMVMGQLVHRDFSDRVQNFGDVVNTSRPNDFSGKRKTDDDNITVQDAVSPNIPVPLDQHIHVSFKIKDGELSKALPDLIERYLEPAARECAEKVDQILVGQVARLLIEGSVGVGGVRLMTKSNASDYVLSANTQLDLNRAPKAGRSLVLGPRAQQAALGADLFVSSEKRGDQGTALRTASLGSVYGLDAYMDQNTPYRAQGDSDVVAGTVDTAAVEGATTVNTDLVHADVTDNEYFDIAGKVYRATSADDGGGDADLTLDRGLEADVAATDPIYRYDAAEVKAAGGQSAGYAKEIDIDTHAANKNLTVGAIVTFGTGASSHSYTVIAASATSTTETQVLLDRPLDSSIAANDAVFIYPAGGVNMAFTRDAVALVSRPLALVPSQAGASSFVASYEGLSMRVTMQYDATAQGMIVTFDLLCGVAVLDERLAVILWS